MELFYNKIKKAIQAYRLENVCCKSLLKMIDEIFMERDIENIKMTQMTIFFEALYCYISDDSSLKEQLRNIRLERWSSHYGTPTLTFLLTYQSVIEKTSALFSDLSILTAQSSKPWMMIVNKDLVVDQDNNVSIYKKSVISVPMPIEEKKGELLKTHNPSGGFTTAPCDPVSEKFLKYVMEIAKHNGTVLEIGAAFGAASLQALEQGAQVFCNDIDPRNLAVVRNRYIKKDLNSVTGDEDNLILLPGSFHEELELPNNFFDAILISRVLHFFSGDKIEKSLEKLADYLKPGGKLFIVCETPFLKNWKKFIPEYEKRLADGVTWPGEITSPADYESSGRITSLPKFVHWITKEILERSLKKIKFGIEFLSYINREGQFPDDLLLDGKESIGAIVYKPF